jgi:hypothetical protein
MKKILLFPSVLLLALFAMAQTPVAYYPFTGNANDAAGVNNGTVNGATLTNDRFGNANSAYSFDGVDDNISINNSATFNFPNSLTISLWVKYNGSGTAGKSVWSLISKNFNGNGNEDQFHLWVNATDKSTGGRFGTGPALVGFGGLPAIDNGLWHQIQVVFDNPNNVINHYLDGVLISTAANTANVFNNGSPIKLGYWEAFNNFWNGAIDEVKIYNTALSAAQVQNEYLGANNYGSQFTNSVKMNGANDQIELGSTYTQQIFTVEMWVKPGATQNNFANLIDNNHTNFINWVCQQNASNTNLYGFGVNTNGVSNGVEFQLQNNVWQHIALIKDATVVQVFVNGVLIQSNPISGSINYSGQFLRLGNWGGGGRNWNGTMDEVRYWNTARTQAQIVANMNSQLTGSEAGLVGYWDMNRNGQGAGLTVDNKATATGAALNGITVGTASTPIFVPGVTQQKPGSGNAISFDGVDDFITVPHSPTLTPAAVTVETWVKINAYSSTKSGGNPAAQYMVFKPRTSGGQFEGYALMFDDIAKKFMATVASSSGVQTTVASSSIIDLNKYYYVVITANNTELKMYVNGMLEATVATGFSLSYNTDPLQIGQSGYAFDGKLNGNLDEVRIWNAALTQSQIRDQMCRKITNTDALYSNLVAYYNFDESTGNSAFDGTANNNSGTLTNNPTRVTSGAAIGNASSHDYVNATKTTTINNAGESFTVTSSTGNPNGIQLYRVDEKPNSETGILGVGPNNRYYGVFQVNGTTPTYSAVYDYTGNPFVTPSNEITLALYKRTDNTISTWINATATLNTTANTLTCPGQSTEYMLGSTGTALPIQLISFTASKQNNNHLLDWVTSNMVNINRFEVEISNDGIAFTKIGVVASSGLNRYSFINNNVSNQVNYYRLKIIDNTNQFKYSTIIKLISQQTNTFSIFPNPAKNVVTISGLQGKGQLQLTNMQGEVLMQQNVQAQSMVINLSTFANGTYILKYLNNKVTTIQKLIKQ